MTERAAHLVDEVLPRVPVRQWVLTVPHRLRYGGRLRLIATVEDPGVIRRILAHLGLQRSGQSPGPAPSAAIATS